MSAADHLRRVDAETLNRSLTPRRDAAQIALADMRTNLGHRLSLPGASGGRARMSLAVQEAVHLSMAGELDAGAPESSVNNEMCKVIGDIVAGLAMRFAHSEPAAKRAEVSMLFLKQIIDQTELVVSNIDNLRANEISGVRSGPINKPGRS